jgi:hypothetical protein
MVRDLVGHLAISPQAVHRHLREMVAEGILVKSGSAPRVLYSLKSDRLAPTQGGRDIMAQCASIFRRHPQVRLVTLFGSYARGRERPDSDIDILVWLAPDAVIGRREIWDFWDRASTALAWRHQVSIIVIRLANTIRLHTLLLDLPEEHQVILDKADYFFTIKIAVQRWREKYGACKIPSFGGRHAWRYTNQPVNLHDIDFDLELGNVA